MANQTSILAIKQIGQIAIIVHDLQAAIAFYRDRLGLRYLFEIPRAAFFDCGGVRLMIGLPELAEFDHPASIIYYKVDELQAAYQALVSQGVKCEDEPHLIAQMEDHDLWMFFLRDPDDNLLGLMSEVRDRSAAG